MYNYQFLHHFYNIVKSLVRNLNLSKMQDSVARIPP